jgi:hypothetical protein
VFVEGSALIFASTQFPSGKVGATIFTLAGAEQLACTPPGHLQVIERVFETTSIENGISPASQLQVPLVPVHDGSQQLPLIRELFVTTK